MTRYFTQDHEWIDVDGAQATVGMITAAYGSVLAFHSVAKAAMRRSAAATSSPSEPPGRSMTSPVLGVDSMP